MGFPGATAEMTQEELTERIAKWGLDPIFDTEERSRGFKKGVLLIFTTVGLSDYAVNAAQTRYFIIDGGGLPSLYQSIRNWVRDYQWWLDNRMLLVTKKYKFSNVDSLTRALYDMGFKYVEASFTDTNFVSVTAKYCYTCDKGVFKYDGELDVNHIGTAAQTLKFFTKWVNDHPEFKATKTRVE